MLTDRFQDQAPAADTAGGAWSSQSAATISISTSQSSVRVSTTMAVVGILLPPSARVPPAPTGLAKVL